MLNIYQKLSEVMKAIEYLTKDDKVEFGQTKYKAISEEKVTSVVRRELIKQGIVIIPIEQTMSVTELIRTDKSVNQRTDVEVKYRIQNIEDKDDYIIATSSGSGVDTQDKGIGKAMTYAYKYLLLRTLAIPTGDDPDKIASEEIDDKIKREIDSESKLITEAQVKTLQGLIKQFEPEVGKEAYKTVCAKYKLKDFSELKDSQYGQMLVDIQSFSKERINDRK